MSTDEQVWSRVEAGHYTTKWDNGLRAVASSREAGDDGPAWSWTVYDAAGQSHGNGAADTLAESKFAAEEAASAATDVASHPPSAPTEPMMVGVAVGAINLAVPAPPPPPLVTAPPNRTAAIRDRNSR